MSVDGCGKNRSDEDTDDPLWGDFESCAQAVTLLYKNPTWKALQTAAASTTQLYKSGLDAKKKAYEKGINAGKQNLAKELYALRRQIWSFDEIMKAMARSEAVSEHGLISRSPSPQQADSQGVSVFQQALHTSPGMACTQRSCELTRFLNAEVRRRRKRKHSPSIYGYRKMPHY